MSGIAAGSVAFGWGDVQTPFGTLATDVALLRLLAITAYVAWSAAWVAALAFPLSTVTDAPVGAVAGTIVIVIVVRSRASAARTSCRSSLADHRGGAVAALRRAGEAICQDRRVDSGIVHPCPS